MENELSKLAAVAKRLESVIDVLLPVTRVSGHAPRTGPSPGTELTALDAVVSRLEAASARILGSTDAPPVPEDLKARLENVLSRLEASAARLVPESQACQYSTPKQGAGFAAWQAVTSRLEVASANILEPKSQIVEKVVEPEPLNVGGKWAVARASFFTKCLLDDIRKKEVAKLYAGESSNSDMNSWSLDQTTKLGAKGDEKCFMNKAELLKPELFTSVSQAVESLNSAEGAMACREGMCVVFSASKSCYFLLYRKDMEEKAFELFKLKAK